MKNTMGNFHYTADSLWAKKEFPKRGWICTSITDLGKASQICEACNVVKIRYVHFLKHADWCNIIEAGCVCTEKLTDDYINPKKQERKLKAISLKRKNFLTFEYLEFKQNGFVISAYHHPLIEGFRYQINYPRGTKYLISPKTYASIKDAKKAALLKFDSLLLTYDAAGHYWKF